MRISGFTHNQSAFDQSFGYDNLDRLSGWSGFNTTQGFGYDLTGNRTSLSIGGSGYAYTVQSTSNRVTQTAGPGGVKSFGFDVAGNTTSAGSLIFAYDARGRIVSATTALGPVTYQLNALSQRVAKTVSGMTTRYHYDANGNLIGETTGTSYRDYAWLGSLPVAILEGTSQYYVHADHLDTPRVVTNASNTIVWRWDSDPFGFFPAAEDPDGNSQLFTLNLRFPGQYFDKETNLHYNYFRDYDPQTGRYVESDPIGLEGGINTYAYVGSNSLSQIDPAGLQVAVPAAPPVPLAPGFINFNANIAQGLTDVINRIVDACTGCPPCDPPVGTSCFVGPHNHPNNYPQLRGSTVHYHMFVRQQIPAPSCQCLWRRDTKTYGKGAAVLAPPFGVAPCPLEVGTRE